MADEQTILLDPEEELTSVRERLEKAPARRIYLIIPQQTRLRSHVGWRLIHARMRELGKELLVISPDRQVRAMARAAGFNVAESLEAPGSRPRSGGTRPGSVTTRGTARSRISSNRGGPESQVPPPRRRLMPSTGSRPPAQSPTAERADYDDEATLERPGRQGPRIEGRPQITPAAFLEEPEERSGPAFGLRIDTTPSVRPSVPHVEEEDEEDLSKDYDDYKTAQSIRESARTGREQPGQRVPSTNLEARESRASAPGRWEHGDRYAFMEDDEQLSPLPEQKASVPGLAVEGPGADVPDISDRSTEIMKDEIEDLGDTAAPDLPQVGSARGLEEPTDRLRGQPERSRPRGRTGQMQPRPFSPRAPRPASPDPDYDDDELAAIQDRPTQEVRPLLRPSGGLVGASTRSSQALRSGTPPQTGAPLRSVPASQKAPGRQLMPPPVTTPRQPARSQRATRKRGRGWWVFIVVVVILLLAGSFLFYFIPSATVTVFLQARTYSKLVQLNATADSQANLPNRVPAQMLAKSFSASGQGTASGTTSVGNAKAQGLVAFTNNSNQDIVVPTGTVITTQSGIQFVTQAEAQVPANNTFPAVPVSAQQSGEIGNVPAGSITVIPSASLASIARYNNVSVSTVNLTVTNTQPTSKGGAANSPAVTTQDLQALTQTLHQKLQKEVSAWLATQVHSGDLRGGLIPDVLGSSAPLPQEQLSGAPEAGQAASSGTFSGTLALSVRVLVARAASLQAAAGAQLNAAALSLRPASMLAGRFPVTLTNIQSKPSKDGSTLAITAKASGAIIARLSAQSISSNLAGKGVSQAASDLKSSLPQAGIQNVQVSVSPAFLSILPLQAGRIQVVLQPVQVRPPKGVPNG